MIVIKPVKYNDTEDYSYMTLLGTEGAYSAVRIQQSSLPEGFYRYELSSGRGERFAFVHGGRSIRYAGDYITRTPLDLDGKDKRAVSSGDWTIFDDRTFDFEAFWERKLSIDKQISNAVYKRDMAMGKTPGGFDARMAEVLDQEIARNE